MNVLVIIKIVDSMFFIFSSTTALNMITFIFLFAIFAFIYLWIKKSYSFWSDKNVPTPPISFPFGSLKNLGTKIPTCIGFNEYYKNFKGKASAIGLYFFMSPTLLILDIELIKDIFIRDFSTFHDRGFFYNKKDDPLSANLVKKLNPFASGFNFTY